VGENKIKVMVYLENEIKELKEMIEVAKKESFAFGRIK
jgi:hypothetical protein